MSRLNSALLAQARLLPFVALLQMALGLFADDYYSLSQHISELGLRENALGTGTRVLAFSLGFSLLLLCAGLFFTATNKRKTSLSMLLLFALAMISNGLFPMGSPLHGLFGAGMIIVLIPVTLTLECSEQLRTGQLKISAALTS